MQLMRACDPPDYYTKLVKALSSPADESWTVATARAHGETVIAENGAKLREARKAVLVLQGKEERVVDRSVPALVKAAVGPTCETVELPGYGHTARPTDGKVFMMCDECASRVAHFLNT
jgi:alpha-beta hydrolase superfamily lysophospholipase